MYYQLSEGALLAGWGEYLRYSSERYRRYGGFSIFIFILDTILRKKYLSGIFSYLAKQKIRYFCNVPWCTCVYVACDVMEQND